MKDVLLFSGGIDSLVSWHMLGRPQCVHFSMGQRYQYAEIMRVQECRRLLYVNCLVSQRLSISGWEWENGVIPMRNVLMALLAMNEFNDEKEITVWMGIPNGESGSRSYDKSFEFRRLVGGLASLTLNKRVEVKSPIDNFTKAELVKWYIEHVVDPDCKNLVNCTIGCYAPVQANQHCGNCLACFKRFACFILNGIDVRYEQRADILKWKDVWEVLEKPMRKMYTEGNEVQFSMRRMAETLTVIDKYYDSGQKP